MGLIKRADIEDYTRDAIVMDLCDLESRGRSVIEAANEQAQRILSEANTERDRLITSASKDGHEQGHKEGFAQGHREGVEQGIAESRAQQAAMMDQLSELWTAQLDAFEHQRDTMLENARTQIVELGAMIAQRVIRRVVELDPTIVLNEIEAVLSGITETTRLVLAVHPEDIGIAQAELPKMIERFSTCEHAQIVTDPALERGSCVARTASGGVVDASIPTQLARIVEALLPNREHLYTQDRISIEQEKAPPAEPEQDQQGDAA